MATTGILAWGLLDGANVFRQATAVRPTPIEQHARHSAPAAPPLIWSARAHGHYYTVSNHLGGFLRRRAGQRDGAWTHTLATQSPSETVQLTGWLIDVPSSRALVVLVHGVGGSASSSYMLKAARDATQMGLSSLRLNLRGADRLGADIYHAGQSADLASVLKDPSLARYCTRYLCGFSLGGHVCLHYATTCVDPDVAAIAAICPPLDLATSARRFDQSARIYRYHVLRGLKQIYRAFATRSTRPLPCPLARVERIASIQEWDGNVVAPRYGFSSAADYYARVSVARNLAQSRTSTLIVSSRHDPMVPYDTVEHWCRSLPPQIVTRCVERGGHVGFPRKTHLGIEGPPGLESQVFAWLMQHRQ